MPELNIEQLVDLTGLSKRTIRFYIQKGLVHAPFGARRTPIYTQLHVHQLLQVKKLKQSGLNLTKISAILNGKQDDIVKQDREMSKIRVVKRMAISQGMHLDIDTLSCSLSEMQINQFLQHITEYLNKIASETNATTY